MFVGVDGVTLDARGSSLDRPVEVFVERLESLDGLPPLSGSPGLTPVTAYYRVGAAEDVWLESEWF